MFQPIYYVLLLLMGFFASCNDAGKQPAADAELPQEGIAAMVRNPATASAPMGDTSLVAVLSFREEKYMFGEVKAGTIIEHTFEFTNTGAVPLILSDVRSTCGCTVAEWPKNPIAPGGKGEIKATFDTKNKNGLEIKPITITANTLPAKLNIFLEGTVIGKPE